MHRLRLRLRIRVCAAPVVHGIAKDSPNRWNPFIARRTIAGRRRGEAFQPSAAARVPLSEGTIGFAVLLLLTRALVGGG
jgi:hypothetical protein